MIDQDYKVNEEPRQFQAADVCKNCGNYKSGHFKVSRPVFLIMEEVSIYCDKPESEVVSALSDSELKNIWDLIVHAQSSSLKNYDPLRRAIANAAAKAERERQADREITKGIEDAAILGVLEACYESIWKSMKRTQFEPPILPMINASIGKLKKRFKDRATNGG